MLEITQEVIHHIFEQAQKGLPNEICGFLAGQGQRVLKNYPLFNIDQSPEHFSMDPKEQIKKMKGIRSESLSLLACYHSHPSTPARPSDEDIRLAYDPNISYVIISLKDSVPVIRSFKIKNYEVEQEDIVIINSEKEDSK